METNSAFHPRGFVCVGIAMLFLSLVESRTKLRLDIATRWFLIFAIGLGLAMIWISIEEAL